MSPIITRGAGIPGLRIGDAAHCRGQRLSLRVFRRVRSEGTSFRGTLKVPTKATFTSISSSSVVGSAARPRFKLLVVACLSDKVTVKVSAPGVPSEVLGGQG